MQDLKIAIAQVDQKWENKVGNLIHFEAILGDLPEVDLIVLPEMFHTAFTMNGEELAEPMDDSIALIWLINMASTKNAAIYTSFIATDGEETRLQSAELFPQPSKLYNRGVFVEPNGAIHFYDKRKTFGLAGESEIYTAGSKATIVKYKGWNINLQICYDLRFPEISRNGLGSNGSAFYDLMLYVANWPERRITHWNTLLQARAIENQCVVVGVNRVGEDANGLSYSGNSAVYSALGSTIHLSEIGKERIDCVTISAVELSETREKLPFLKDRNNRSFNS